MNALSKGWSIADVDLVPPPDLSGGRRFSRRQTEILENLETIFLREGFRDPTIGDLAARVRCSRATLYLLADSKDELVLLVLDRLLQRIGRNARAVVRQHDDPVDRVREYLFACVLELRKASLPFSEDLARHAMARQLFETHYRFATRSMEFLLREGIARGVFRDFPPRLAAEVLDASVVRMHDPEIQRATGLPLSDALSETISLFLDGLRDSERDPESA